MRNALKYNFKYSSFLVGLCEFTLICGITDVYIYILLDTVLATDVNKYSLASARCQPIWQTLVGELDLFLAVAKDCGIA